MNGKRQVFGALLAGACWEASDGSPALLPFSFFYIILGHGGSPPFCRIRFFSASMILYLSSGLRASKSGVSSRVCAALFASPVIKATPGAEAFCDAGFWANAVGKYAESYELYLASKTWPQRAMEIALHRLNDPGP